MRFDDSTIWSLILVASIILGIVFNSFCLYLIPLIALSIVLILVGFTIDLIIKGNKWIRIFGFTFFFFVFTEIFAIGIQKVRTENEKKISYSVIKSLYNYHKEFGFYPANIDTLKTNKSILKKFKRNQIYWCDENQQEFRINFSLNDFVINIYSSKDSLWYIDDGF